MGLCGVLVGGICVFGVLYLHFFAFVGVGNWALLCILLVISLLCVLWFGGLASMLLIYIMLLCSVCGRGVGLEMGVFFRGWEVGFGTTLERRYNGVRAKAGGVGCERWGNCLFGVSI